MDIENQIQKLRQTGLSYQKISEITGVSSTAVRYKCNPEYRKCAKIRSEKYRQKHPLHQKVNCYCDVSRTDKDFETKDLIEKLGQSPHCYLTGTPINLQNKNEYSLDHIIPASKGGKSNFDNLGLIRQDVNKAKNDRSVNEFIEMCKEVLIYNGYSVK